MSKPALAVALNLTGDALGGPTGKVGRDGAPFLADYGDKTIAIRGRDPN